MTSIPVFDAKTRLSELLVQVQAGEEFVITRHGVPMARLVAVDAGAEVSARAEKRAAVDEAIAGLARLRKGVTLDIPLKDAIADGRD
jgi:prevent-host-death family protein